MKQSVANILNSELVDEMDNTVPSLLSGNESLSVGESISFFFKEVSNTLDKKLTVFNGPVHVVPYDRNKIESINFLRNDHVEIPTPEGYNSGLGTMSNYVELVCNGPLLINNLNSEARNIYHWIKQVIKMGRAPRPYAPQISGIPKRLDAVDKFLKLMPENKRKLNFRLRQVYADWNDMLSCIDDYNKAVKTLGSNTPRQVANELELVYEIGSLLATKVTAGDLVVSKETLMEVEKTVSEFIRFVNQAGALLLLMNELQATFKAQLAIVEKIK